MYRAVSAAAAIAFAVTAPPALAQQNSLSFSLRGGVVVLPEYFGSDSYRVGPTGGTGLSNLRIGPLALGDPGGPQHYATGPSVSGAFRAINRRRGKDELAGMENIKTSFEIGLRASYTEEFWNVFAELRYGVVGHTSFAGEVGADLLWRDPGGFILNAGPRAQFGSGRFNRTYFGVTEAEAADPRNSFDAFRPSSGFHKVGFEIGGYQPLGNDWALTAGVRYDRLRGDAARSPIVKQGSRDQFSGELGLMRHFNFRF